MSRRIQGEDRVYSLPRWRVTRWLADAGPGVPDDIRLALVAGLFGTLPVFAVGVINTLAVSGAIAARLQTAPVIAWFVLEVVVCASRLIVLIISRRAALARRRTPTDIYLLLGIAWSISVGYGVIVSLTSGDWVAATLACLSAAAMVGGICIRNFSAPRFAGTMILTSVGPTLPGVVLTAEPLLYLVFAQVPMYLVAMTGAAFTLNKMLIATMRAERENDHRARHDALTGLSNRAGLADALDTRLAAADGDQGAFALLFLDLDDFKTVNDTYGHAAGDRLLKMVADRLTGMLTTTDVAARIGGDEFVVLSGGGSPDCAITLGQQLIAAVGTSYDLSSGISVRIGVSIGIAMAPAHGTDIENLLAAADAGLYEAKSGGKSRCCMACETSMLARLSQRWGKSGRSAAPIGAAA